MLHRPNQRWPYPLNACRLKPKDGSSLINFLALIKDGVILKNLSKLVSLWRVKDGQFLPFGVAFAAVRRLVTTKDSPCELST
eukprot:3871700-Pyramimonas_sp.AAC.1